MANPDIDELFAKTLAGNYDDDEPWAAVQTLRTHGSRAIFERASEWCNSGNPLKRARGCSILGQLRAPQTLGQEDAGSASDPVFTAESFQIISHLLAHEADETALAAELYALGHLRQDGTVPLLTPYAADSRPDIRYAATHALGQFTSDLAAIESLVKLADDTDENVRNWSLFALGSQSEADSPALRELFVRHLDDRFEDAQQEAIAGLAKRQDQRAVLPLLRLMESGSYSSPNHYDFLNLVSKQSDSSDWGTEDFIDALYDRFPQLLPKRDQVASEKSSS
jgi:hypothetical protein